ncbi:hypothetical protein [Nakamurella lactea]|uniref:hypothetical protein n=1 Tax=Nakamurella lactea TaxID=459515 RepID=UPI00041C624F|nr:hypothetical protein [Nakamurella lactea]
MGVERIFRPITVDELRWFPELDSWPQGEHNPDFLDMFWLDVDLDDGWQLGIGLYRCRPYDDGNPGVTVNLIRPGERTVELHERFRPEQFTADELGGRWGDTAALALDVVDGVVTAIRLMIELGELVVTLAVDPVCPGVKFSGASPGFSGYRKSARLAVGWWPVTPRAVGPAAVTWRGEHRHGTAVVHAERQLSTLPLAGDAGDASAQSIWFWGHFTAGDYTAIWTDSAASAAFGNGHFSPFVLYYKDFPVLSTFAFAAQVEQFVVDPTTGMVRPEVTTLRAWSDDLEFSARLVDGQVSDQFELNGRPGSLYCRQVSTVQGRLAQWGRTRPLTGTAVHEWGSQAGNFPFPRTAK